MRRGVWKRAGRLQANPTTSDKLALTRRFLCLVGSPTTGNAFPSTHKDLRCLWGRTLIILASERYRAGDLSQERLAFSSNEVETHDRAEAKEVSPRDPRNFRDIIPEKKPRNSTWQFYCRALNASVISCPDGNKSPPRWLSLTFIVFMISQLGYLYLF